MGCSWRQPSNGLHVDLGILPVGADEPDIDNAIGIIDPHYDAILIARDVEDSAAVVENARTADGSLDVRLPRASGVFSNSRLAIRRIRSLP